MRSLLEWRAGIVSLCKNRKGNPGRPVSVEHLAAMNAEQIRQAEAIIRLFGIAGDAESKDAEKYGPTRLAFWDLEYTSAYRQFLKENHYLYTEAKSENVIDRIKGVAEHPRQMERVPSGAAFSFRLNLKHLAGDSAELLDTIKVGLRMMELDSLGGSGSRGYGKISFEGLKMNGEPLDLPKSLD
jgi:CRISPR-associated protein Csm3